MLVEDIRTVLEVLIEGLEDREESAVHQKPGKVPVPVTQDQKQNKNEINQVVFTLFIKSMLDLFPFHTHASHTSHTWYNQLKDDDHDDKHNHKAIVMTRIIGWR